MKRRKYNTQAAVAALHKLQGEGGGAHSMFSSHPAPGARADKIAAQLK